MKNKLLSIINSKGSKWFPLLITFLALAFYSYESYAGGVKWLGGASSDWETAANWEGSVLPDNQDITIDGDDYTFAPIITIASTFVPKKITVQDVGVLTINGALANQGGKELDIKGAGSQVTVNANLDIDDFIKVQTNGNLIVTGGAITVDAEFDLLTNATMTMSGGTLTVDTDQRYGSQFLRRHDKCEWHHTI